MITKLLVGAAIVLGCSLGLAAQAHAGPDAFGGLSCSCRETAPPGSPALSERIEQGIHDGIQGRTGPVDFTLR